MKRDYRDEFKRWKEAGLLDEDLISELKAMEQGRVPGDDVDSAQRSEKELSDRLKAMMETA